MFTDLDLTEIKEISNQNINEQKIILANEATSILHGSNEAAEAEKIARNSFSGNLSGENLPNTKIDISNIGNDVVNLVSIIDKNLSKSEIRRLIKSNGIKINNEIIKGFQNENFTTFLNREMGLREAINNAKMGDIVAILGKGKEEYQEINGEKLYYSDVEIIMEYR